MGSTARTPRPRACDERPHGAIVAIVGGPQEANLQLAAGWLERGIPAALLSPQDAIDLLAPLDTALLRLDVLRTLDGIEEGLDDLYVLAERGVRVLNPPSAMLATHDKLRTARHLVAAGLPHPKTVHLPTANAPLGLRPPLVLKPRFGSWGDDVFRCETDDELGRVLADVRGRRWFRRHGALLQELVPSGGHDARILVARGRVVGGAQRVAAPGEWRTNVTRGAARFPLRPSPEMSRLAIAAAAAVGADFVGVDLLPGPSGHVVIELNGAVEFNRTYDLAGRDVYSEIADAIGLARAAEAVR
jgi:RimK family alpha-L-glutamate ligase